MKCEYPECNNTELNEYNMCKEHEVNYGPSKANKKAFDIKYIQDGLKRLAKEQRMKNSQLSKAAQEHLL